MDLKQASINVLYQLADVIEQLSQEQYSQPLEILLDTPISKHVRHVVEFYGCLFNETDESTVSYDRRERNRRIETDRCYALSLLHNYIDCIRECGNTNSGLTLLFHTFDHECTSVATTFHRELLYNMEHAIHHLAMLKIAICNDERFADIYLPEDFGMAHSTLRHRRE